MYVHIMRRATAFDIRSINMTPAKVNQSAAAQT